MPLINNPLAEAKTATTIMIKTREKKPEQAQNPKEKQAPKTQKAANVAAVPATAKPLIVEFFDKYFEMSPAEARQLDFEKIKRTTDLVFNSAWLIATDDDRPAAPR